MSHPIKNNPIKAQPGQFMDILHPHPLLGLVELWLGTL
jgi:hypothetical protein